MSWERDARLRLTLPVTLISDSRTLIGSPLPFGRSARRAESDRSDARSVSQTGRFGPNTMSMRRCGDMSTTARSVTCRKRAWTFP